MFKITLATAPDHDIKIDFCIYLYVLKYEDLKPGPISLNMSLRTTQWTNFIQQFYVILNYRCLSFEKNKNKQTYV